MLNEAQTQHPEISVSLLTLTETFEERDPAKSSCGANIGSQD